MPGSTMTRSPFGSVRMKARGWLASYCSAIKGDMQHLKKPLDLPSQYVICKYLFRESYTPVPNKINPRMNEARAPSGFGPMT
jgi:hypothetical protein